METFPYMHVKRIEFMVTYQCSGRCKHCSVDGKLNHSGGVKHVAESRAVEVVEELADMFSISSIMTFGGEPLLYADVVCAIHETAGRCGIDRRQLITNGYFTKEEGRRKQVAMALKEAGVNDLLLSVDAFHQEAIPLEVVHSFVRYVQEAGVENVKLHPAWVVDERHDNPYNEGTREIIATFAEFGIPVSRGNNIFMAGNAVTHLAQYYGEPSLDWTETCGGRPYTEPLDHVTSLSIVPNGDVMVCGFTIGNIHKQSMREIVSQYDPYQNEWMNAILTGGASALLALAKQKGVGVDCSQCYSVCDLCHKVNGTL